MSVADFRSGNNVYPEQGNGVIGTSFDLLFPAAATLTNLGAGQLGARGVKLSGPVGQPDYCIITVRIAGTGATATVVGVNQAAGFIPAGFRPPVGVADERIVSEFPSQNACAGTLSINPTGEIFWTSGATAMTIGQDFNASWTICYECE